MHSFILTAALAAGALAAPAPVGTFDDNYDNLPSNPVFPELDPVGTYHGLTYVNFDVANVDVGSDGFKAHSANNVASTVEDPALKINGFPADFVPFGAIQRGPNTASFSLASFYYACSGNTGTTAATAAEACTVAVQGYFVDGTETAEERYVYAPNTASPTNAMAQAVLPATFVGLQNVTFGLVSSVTTPITTVLSIDDLVHTNL